MMMMMMMITFCTPFVFISQHVYEALFEKSFVCWVRAEWMYVA